MRDVLKKYNEAVTLQAEELINLSKLENKFNDNIFPLRDIKLEKIRVENLSAEILYLMDEDDDFMVKQTILTKFSVFTETKLLMIHFFIEGHNSSNLQQSCRSSSENNTETSPVSDSCNRIKLLITEILSFDGQGDLWKEFFW